MRTLRNERHLPAGITTSFVLETGCYQKSRKTISVKFGEICVLLISLLIRHQRKEHVHVFPTERQLAVVDVKKGSEI
jgi:hypothetical protein